MLLAVDERALPQQAPRRKSAGMASVLSALIATIPWGPLLAQAAENNPLGLVPNHATASVADLEKEGEWYRRVLGFREIRRMQGGPDFAVLQMGIPGYRIDLVWQKGSSRPHEAQGALEQGWLHVVFETPAIDAAYKRLVDLGTDVKADRNAQAAITRLVFHDPEGNELEIVPR
jgi:catechol 2,3-dioxygenase-like lactoylglutathione lyase family enzyme